MRIRNKIFIALSCFCISYSQISNAIEYEDLRLPKPPAYRLGITDDVEKKTTINPLTKKRTQDVNAVESIDKLTYADLSIKNLSKELSKELGIDEELMKIHLSMLWQGAASKSDIIKFTLYKLANPDKDKPDEKSVKKVLQSIANMSTLLGAGTGNALLSAGSFLNGSILGIFAQDDKDLNYRYTKVNDADMVVLVRKIDDLQQKVVNRYCDYITAKTILEMSKDRVDRSYENYRLSQNQSKEIILITDANYRKALDAQMKATLDFQAIRASLEELVGTETLLNFEADLKEN
jgi:hypothetical protein